MTDHENTDERDEQVRRLLADARHTEPVPDEVVARLDRVLAGLATEPAREATVVRLADRRRRATRMLVAAAAVVVLGVGINQVVGGVGGSVDEATSGADAGATSDEEPAAAPEVSGDGAAPTDRATRARPFRVSAQKFSRDAVELQGLSAAYEYNDSSEAQTDDQANLSLLRAAVQDVCAPGDWGQGGYVPVLYDRAPGWVVIRPEQGDSQVVDLFLCGSEQAARSVTLPQR